MSDEDPRDLILREIYVVYMPGDCPFCGRDKGCRAGCVGQKILEWGSKACLMDMERE